MEKGDDEMESPLKKIYIYGSDCVIVKTSSFIFLESPSLEVSYAGSLSILDGGISAIAKLPPSKAARTFIQIDYHKTRVLHSISLNCEADSVGRIFPSTLQSFFHRKHAAKASPGEAKESL